MKKVFPNLARLYINSVTFESYFEGDKSKSKEFFLNKNYTNNFDKDNFFAGTEFKFNKIPYFFGLFVHFTKKSKINILIQKEYGIKEDKELKKLSEEDFIGFFHSLHANKKVELGRVSMTADSSLPLNRAYSLPPLIEDQQNKASYLTGLRFGFDKKYEIDTLIIERTQDKKFPIHFYIQTLPYFNFNKDFCNERFFESPLKFIERLYGVYLNRGNANATKV
jgi:hypothetical protein